MSGVPNYLKSYSDLYATDPRAAALQWFREARYGLFLHYGLYSLLGRHEWVQLRELISVSEYASLWMSLRQRILMPKRLRNLPLIVR